MTATQKMTLFQAAVLVEPAFVRGTPGHAGSDKFLNMRVVQSEAANVEDLIASLEKPLEAGGGGFHKVLMTCRADSGNEVCRLNDWVREFRGEFARRRDPVEL